MENPESGDKLSNAFEFIQAYPGLEMHQRDLLIKELSNKGIISQIEKIMELWQKGGESRQTAGL